ncbi:hypothetical protein BJ944DRAFT_272276 [Cunninghamella echinulata]|nr:hypothetical protein BJ944DRAFT_272276 [Cunninghamella echinulata]
MNQDLLIAKNIYKEYKQTINKIGEKEAVQQYVHSQSNKYFLLLLDFYHLQSYLSTFEESELVQQRIRNSIQVISKESLIYEFIEEFADILDTFDELEQSTGPRKGDLQHVYQGFVYLPTRCDIIKSLLKNRPLDFDMTFSYLLKSIRVLTKKHIIFLSEMIYSMVDVQPNQARRIRYQLTELRILPNLITQLTIHYCNDDYADFLNGIFNQDTTWFLTQSATNSTAFTKMKIRLFDELLNDTQFNNITEDQPIYHYAKIMGHIRAIIGLVGFFGVRLTDQEIQYFLKLLDDIAMEKIIKLILCLVLISADQMIKHQKNLTEKIVNLIQTGDLVMPLLLMTYFKNNEIYQIEDMIRTILCMNIPIAKLGLFEMQKLFNAVNSYI